MCGNQIRDIRILGSIVLLVRVGDDALEILSWWVSSSLAASVISRPARVPSTGNVIGAAGIVRCTWPSLLGILLAMPGNVGEVVLIVDTHGVLACHWNLADVAFYGVSIGSSWRVI
jgi:hypothetical protein